MSFRRVDMRNPKMTKQDKKDYRILSRRYAYCDKHISNKFLKEIGILLTSHPGNRAFLKASVDTHSKTKLWITLAYDNYFDPERNESWDDLMPRKEVINKVNAFILSPFQKWGGVLYPFFWILRLGISAMENFSYIYCSNGDCIIEKPKEIFTLLEILKQENADFIACGWWDGERPIFGSTGFIAKTEAIQAVMKHFQDHFIPLKAYEASCLDFGNCEGRMGRAIKDLGLKVVPVENPRSEQLHKPLQGTWSRTLGFRHVHGEFAYAWKHRNSKDPPIPPELKYYDESYLPSQDIEFIKKFWETDKSKL